MSMRTRLLKADIQPKNGTVIGSLHSYPKRFRSCSTTEAVETHQFQVKYSAVAGELWARVETLRVNRIMMYP